VSAPTRRRPERPARLASWHVVAGLVVGFFALGFLFSTLIFRGGGADVASVPDLREMPLEQARRVLREASLGLDEGPALAHPTLPAGSVISQSPLPGQEVAPGSAVRVNVSTGGEQVRVPDVSAYAADQARQMLERVGFQVRVVERAAMRREGQIIELSPAAGAVVALPAVLTLVVSSGPPMVAVPQLAGLYEPEVRSRLGAASLAVGEADYDVFSTLPVGQVIAQRPAAGDSLRAGSRVRITYAGPAPLPIPEELDG
jgi:eukaryotic-like serine/threonine-protein kinase